AAALGHLAVREVDPGVDAEAADHTGDRIPRHVHEAPAVVGHPPVAQGVVRRHDGSLSSADLVKLRSARTVRPYMSTADVEIAAPGGSFMNGMNLSGKPGIVQPMQTPPTLGQPPMPFIQPRLGTLQTTTGPQQPSFTMHFFEP